MNDLLICIMITFVVALATGFAVARIWSGGSWEQVARDHNWWSFDEVSEKLEEVRAHWRKEVVARDAEAGKRLHTVISSKDEAVASREQYFAGLTEIWKVVAPNEVWSSWQQARQRVKDLVDQSTSLLAAAHAGTWTHESIDMLATALGVALPQVVAVGGGASARDELMVAHGYGFGISPLSQEVREMNFLSSQATTPPVATPPVATPVVRRVATIINDTWQFGTVVGEVFITSNMLRVKMDDGSEIVRDATRCQSVVPF